MSPPQPAAERLYNDERARGTKMPDNPTTFHLFPLLPKEQRLKVWRTALEGRQRIIRIFLTAHIETDGTFSHDLIRTIPSPCLAASTPGGLLRSPQNPNHVRAYMTNYTAIADGDRLHSKLLHVNSEARAAALVFYRVSLPVVFGGNQAEAWKSTVRVTAGNPSDDGTPGLVRLNQTATWAPSGLLHLSPEHDFLQILHGWNTTSFDSHITMDFIQRFKTVHDPRGVGLLNLVVDEDFVKAFPPPPDEGGPDPEQAVDAAATVAFRDTLAQLREVFFVHLCPNGRIFGWPPACRKEADPFINESLPVMTLAPSFSRLPRGPRPVGLDLSRVPIENRRWHPTLLFKQWSNIMDAAESAVAEIAAAEGDIETADDGRPTTSVPQTQFHVLVAADPAGSARLCDRKSGLSWIRVETDEKFPRLCELRSREGLLAPGFARRLEAARSAGRQVSPVLGFWLFPLDAVPQPAQSRRQHAEVMDLSAHWPELGVFDLC